MYEVEPVRAVATAAEPELYKTDMVRRVWHKVMETRIPDSQWSTGNVIICVVYTALNVLSLAFGYFAGGYSIERGLGSLAAANTLFLIIPATRNNLLTWALGLPFGHIILYHRFLGRITIGIAFLHGAMYLPHVMVTSAYVKYWTGAGALFCGLIIVATTFDFMRRKHFNLFFYAHYSFLGYFVLAYMHVRQARPFLMAGVGSYVVDKLLRTLWTLVPRKTIVFRPRGEGMAQVQWPKNCLSSMLGHYKVGQYMFVNFPELSLHEWHPFSVSSAPWENYLELHIRALGDHTKEINALAKVCQAENRQTWIRGDGPYGVHDFDYRRYGVLLLVGGGVGVTPVLGIMKELYGGYEGGARGEVPPHCIKKVICVHVVPQKAEAETFKDDFAQLQAFALANEKLPELDMRIYCTRAKKDQVWPLATSFYYVWWFLVYTAAITNTTALAAALSRPPGD